MLGMYTADFSWEFLTCCATKTYSGDDTFCPMCKTEPENEIHFLLKCPAYASMRQHYIPANDSSASGQEHFKIVMHPVKELDVIHSVAKFLYLAFKHGSLGLIFLPSLSSVCVCTCTCVCVCVCVFVHVCIPSVLYTCSGP